MLEISNFNYLKITSIKLLFLCFLMAISFSSVNSALAEDSYGWLASKVEYVDDSADAVCASDEASIEFVLAEGISTTTITDSIGSWRVNIRESSSDSSFHVNDSLDGQKKSNVLCFDPVSNGIQIAVYDSTNYHELITPTIFPDSTDTTSLSQMRGSHFRGYVHLINKGSGTSPNVQSLCTVLSGSCVTYATTTPEFSIRSNSVDSLYSSDAITKTNIYIQNQISGSPTNAYSFTTNYANNIGTFPIAVDLDEGNYYWTFHQELDGIASTQRSTIPAWNWNFGSMPVSGMPPVQSFTVDKTAPVSTISNFLVGTTTANASDPADLEFTSEISDNLSGIAEHRVYVMDPAANIVFDNTYVSPVSLSFKIQVPNLTKGIEYTVYTETTDQAGNVNTAVDVSYTIPLLLTVPTVIGYTGSTHYGNNYSTNGIPDTLHATNNRLHGTVFDKDTNPLKVISDKLCYSLVEADIVNYPTAGITPNITCKETSWFASHDYNGAYNPFYHLASTTADQQVFFRLGAQNDLGWGYTEVKTYHTPPSVFAPCDTCVPSVPVVTLTAWPAPVSSNNARARVTIMEAGYSPITKYGICFFLDPYVRDNFDPTLPLPLGNPKLTSSDVVDSGDCIDYGSLDTSKILPYNHGTHGFNGVLPETTYYVSAFAVNSTGVGYATTSVVMGPHIYDFLNTTLDVTVNDSDFSQISDTFGQISVDVAGRDWSTNNIASTLKLNRRAVPMRVDIDVIDLDGNHTLLSKTKLVYLQKRFVSYSLFPETVVFDSTDIPGGFPPGVVEVTTTLNPDDNYGSELTTGSLTNVKFTSVPLIDPFTIDDEASDTDDSDGNPLAIDPELHIRIDPNTVRYGNTATLEWDMLNPYSGALECRIYGPSNFATAGVHGPFDPHSSGSAVGSPISGSVPTPVINHTQIFKFECISLTPPDTFVHEARLRVVGTSIEL